MKKVNRKFNSGFNKGGPVAEYNNRRCVVCNERIEGSRTKLIVDRSRGYGLVGPAHDPECLKKK